MAYKGYPIEKLPADFVYGEREILAQYGIWTTRRVLKNAAKLRNRLGLSKKTGIPTSRLLDMANMADLMRVKGLGTDYIRLLRACEVPTVRELVMRNPSHLHEKLINYNKIHDIVLFPPSLGHVTRWIENAKLLEPKISY